MGGGGAFRLGNRGKGRRARKETLWQGGGFPVGLYGRGRQGFHNYGVSS